MKLLASHIILLRVWLSHLFGLIVTIKEVCSIIVGFSNKSVRFLFVNYGSIASDIGGDYSVRKHSIDYGRLELQMSSLKHNRNLIQFDGQNKF